MIEAPGPARRVPAGPAVGLTAMRRKGNNNNCKGDHVMNESEQTKVRRAAAVPLRSLTPEQVADLRARWANGETLAALAERFGVSRVTARAARTGTGSYRGV